MVTIFYRKCCCLLTKENRILKVIFTISASLLILNTFYNFIVVKPTYSSSEKREISVEDIPEMMICPQPSIDLDAVRSRGYPGNEAYVRGISDRHNLEQIGWAGNKSEGVKKVIEEVSILKSTEECPTAIFWFPKNMSQVQADLKLAKALNPHHICCQVIPPNLSQTSPLISVHLFLSNNSHILNIFSVKNNSERSPVQSFEVFLADKMTASLYDQHRTILDGDKIVSDNSGFMKYKVKIIEEERLEGDPKYPCIDYMNRGQYAKCVENEIVRQQTEFLNCTPPWMTDNEDYWCKGKFGFKSITTREKYINFMKDISDGEANYGKCLAPCKVKKYFAKEVGLRKVSNLRGLIIRFAREVDITKSMWTIDGTTLISKIGGFIGINKNFLWIITLSISSIGVLISKVKLNHRQLSKQANDNDMKCV